MAAWAHQVMIAVVAILLRILGFRDFRLVSLLENTSSTNSQNNCKHNVNSIWEQRPMQVPPTMPQSMGTKKMNEVPCSPWSMETVLQIGCCGRVATEVFSKPDAHRHQEVCPQIADLLFAHKNSALPFMIIRIVFTFILLLCSSRHVSKHGG